MTVDTNTFPVHVYMYFTFVDVLIINVVLNNILVFNDNETTSGNGATRDNETASQFGNGVTDHNWLGITNDNQAADENWLDAIDDNTAPDDS